VTLGQTQRYFQPQPGIRDDSRDALLLPAAFLIDQTILMRAWGVRIPSEPLTVENKYRRFFP
jgi:hypothetical protein